MAKTVAYQFVETLATAGIKRISGIVGDSLNGLTDAVRRHGKIEWRHVRHEEVATFGAGAEAHLTGALAACAGSCGPCINGLLDCHRSRVPVLGIPPTFARPGLAAASFRRPTRSHRERPRGRSLTSSRPTLALVRNFGAIRNTVRNRPTESPVV